MSVETAGDDRWRIEPLWKGETVVVMGSGPSLRRYDADYVRGKARVIVVNDQCGTAPWGDLLYACDKKWWEHPEKRRLHEKFDGIKVSLETTGLPDVRRVDRAMSGRSYVTTGLSFDPGVIVTGGNSGYQAINIAVQLGVRRIVLLGFDLKPGKNGTMHNHGRHPSPLNNPTTYHFGLWIDNFRSINEPLASAGIEIVNATSDSALTAFPMIDLRDCL
jgi:hypothetical protein